MPSAFQTFCSKNFIISEAFLNTSNQQLLKQVKSQAKGGKGASWYKHLVEGNDTCDCHIPGSARELKHQAETVIWITGLPYCQEVVKKLNPQDIVVVLKYAHDILY